MTPYDATELARLVEQVRSTGRGRSNHAKGMAMADLVAHLFGQVPGVELRHREFIDPDHSSEIDLVFRNQPQVSGLFNGGHPASRVQERSAQDQRRGGPHLRLQAGGTEPTRRRDDQPNGSLRAAGLQDSRARDKVALELASGRTIVVLALQELAGLCDSSQLVNLCIERRFELEAFRTYNTI